MSDRELRQVLRDVIEDIDAGRVAPQWNGKRLRHLIAGSALAAGLALAGCGRPVYGVPGPDTGPTDAYGVPVADARPDTGPMDAYGVPIADAGLDAEISMDASQPLDDGGVYLYYAPPPPDDEADDDEADEE